MANLNAQGTPKVSVVMPLYNKAPFVERSITSVLGQSFENFELIVVNDGSTDNSEELVRNFSDPRIKLFSTVNRGVSCARNKALDSASGEWVAFIDADDEWSADHLMIIVNVIRENPQALIICDEYRGKGYSFVSQLIESNSGWLTPSATSDVSVVVFDYLNALVSGLFVVSCSSAMVRRSALEKYGVRFQEGMRYGEDLNFWIRLSRLGSFIYCDYPGSLYHRDDPNSGMNRRLRSGERAADLFFGLIKSDFTSAELDDIRKFLARERLKTAFRNRGAKFSSKEIASVNFYAMNAFDVLCYVAIRYLPRWVFQLVKRTRMG